MNDKPFVTQEKLWPSSSERKEADRLVEALCKRMVTLNIVGRMTAKRRAIIDDLVVGLIMTRNTWLHQLRLNDRYPYPKEAGRLIAKIDSILGFINDNPGAVRHIEQHPILRKSHPYGGGLRSTLSAYKFAASLQLEHKAELGRQRNQRVRISVERAAKVLTKILGRQVTKNWKMAPAKEGMEFINPEGQWIAEVAAAVFNAPPNQVKSALEALTKNQKSST